MYVVGSPVYLSAAFTDINGNPIDPTTVVLNLTLPDGTSSGALATIKDSVGNYHCIYTPTESGIYQYYFAGSGTNPAVQLADIFTVAGTSTPALISINDAKLLLNKSLTSHVDDGEILAFIQSATEIIHTECGFVVPTTFTEITSGVVGSGSRQMLKLSNTPVLSVASITPVQQSMPTIDITTLQIDANAGVIWLANWFSWYGPQSVVYTAGRTSIPPSLQDACKLIVAYFWETQRGGAVDANVAGFGGSDMGDVTGEPGFPTRALDLMAMGSYYAAPGLA
jgi:hypothetical protein